MEDPSYDLREKFEVNKNPAKIPGEDIGKLSYYLNCISTCLPGMIDPYLTQYTCTKDFTPRIQDNIIHLCSILKPSTLENRVIKLVSKADLNVISPGADFAFIPLTEKTNLTFLELENGNEVEGLNLKNAEVAKMMIYHEKWLQKTYSNPYENLVPLRVIIEEEKIDISKPQKIVDYSQSKISRDIIMMKKDNGLLFYIWTFGIIAFFGIFGLFYTFCNPKKKPARKRKACLVAAIGMIVNIVLLYLLYIYHIVDVPVEDKLKTIEV